MNKWQPVIHNCDFILVRKEISDAFELWQCEAASEGGKYYMHPDFTKVWTAFAANPCADTAAELLEIAPAFASYFEACRPGGVYYQAAALQNGISNRQGKNASYKKAFDVDQRARQLISGLGTIGWLKKAASRLWAGSAGVARSDSTREIAEEIYRQLVEELQVHAPEEYRIPEHLRAVFSAKVGLYREAIILFVLKSTAEKNNRYEKLLQSFELLVFPRTMNDAGITKLQAIRAAMKDIGEFIDSKGKELSWSNAWLKSVGREETNPVVLLQFALMWQQIIINTHDAIEELSTLLR